MAAIVITCSEGNYAEVMHRVRATIRPEDLGIKTIRPRKARTGALLLEIPGADCNSAADALAARMRQILAKKAGISVSRPIKMAKLRLKDVEDSISTEKIINTITETEKCFRENIKVSPMRKAFNDIGTVWAKCPLTAANLIKRIKSNLDRLWQGRRSFRNAPLLYATNASRGGTYGWPALIKKIEAKRVIDAVRRDMVRVNAHQHQGVLFARKQD